MMREQTNWDAVAEAERDVAEPGPAQRYTQMQCLIAFLKGLKKGRRASEWNCDEPLHILQTDLWTESVARSRQLLGGALHLAWSKGFFTSYYTTCGMDVSGEVCRLAAPQTEANIVQADIRALPFLPYTFDIIFDPSTVDHVPFDEALRVMEEYHRALRFGGVLVMIYAHYQGTLRQGSGDSYYVFSPRHVRSHLRSIGFDVLGEYAICCLNTQPVGVLTSRRLHVQRLVYQVFTWLEYMPLSRCLLGRVAPLWVVVAKKRGEG